MNKTLIVLLFSLTTIVAANAQKGAGRLVVAFYNVENLFDTIDDPAKDDSDFLPGSKVPWTGKRYESKIANIIRVLTSIDSTLLPAVVGLAEVENVEVVRDLISREALKQGQYGVVFEEGSDPRGIDVAFIYRKNQMQYVNHKAIPSASSFKTRNLLCVKLTDPAKNSYFFVVNHWKSRSGGAKETAAKRAENARILKHCTDSLLSSFPGARIILMGDFNDEPADSSLATVFGALAPSGKMKSDKFYNLLYPNYQRGEGTLYYKDWDLFDQLIVTGNMLLTKPGKGPHIAPPYGYILKKDWLLYTTKNGEKAPNRTASGKEYFGGYSDHLPVYTVIRY